jgi:hypothetical protein
MNKETIDNMMSESNYSATIKMDADMKTFIDIQKEYNVKGVSLVIFKYLKIIEHLYSTEPHQNPLWYQTEALRRTETYYKAHPKYLNI